MRNALKYSLMALSALLFTGCVLVDQDMSDCETDYTLDYELCPESLRITPMT